MADWKNPEALMDLLYCRAEKRATTLSEWYLADKKGKKRASRTLRMMAIVLGTAGGVVPLLPLALIDLRWGYLSIALAGAAVATDKFFGFSSAWMRDIAGAQAVQEKLADLQYDWTSLRIARNPDPIEGIARLQRFSAELSAILRDETSQWQNEFDSSLTQLDEMLRTNSPKT